MTTGTAMSSESTIVINPIKTETIRVCLVGESPLIQNRLAEKARQELLLPRGRRTAADKAGSLKHDPLEEFASSPYRLDDERAPTLLAMPTTAFKGAMMMAAIDAGAKKAQIGRLVYVEGDLTPVFGVPEVLMSIVRSADMNKTPDVRTRAILPTWATQVTLTFMSPNLNRTSILNLLSAAGSISGVGDWRPEKGKGAYGRFRVTDETDEEYRRIVEHGGRAAQVAAMRTPIAHNSETEELLSWFNVEARARGKK